MAILFAWFSSFPGHSKKGIQSTPIPLAYIPSSCSQQTTTFMLQGTCYDQQKDCSSLGVSLLCQVLSVQSVMMIDPEQKVSVVDRVTPCSYHTILRETRST